MMNERNKSAWLRNAFVVSMMICACLIIGGGQALGQEKTVTEPYKAGKGWTKTTTTITRKDYESTTIIIRAPDHRIVAKHVIVHDGNNNDFIDEEYDAHGVLIARVENIFPIVGLESSHKIEIYEDGKKKIGEIVEVTDEHGKRTMTNYWKGKQIAGYIEGVDEHGKLYIKNYNPDTDTYDDFPLYPKDSAQTPDKTSTPTPSIETKVEQPGLPATSLNEAKPSPSPAPSRVPTPTEPTGKKNEVSIDFSTIREDSKPESFPTRGVTIEFTRRLNNRWMLRGSFDTLSRQHPGADVRKTSLLGGVAVAPFKGAQATDKVTVSVGALFGVAHFTSDNGIVSSSDNSFTMRLGGALDVNVGKSFFVRPIGIDYAPTFFGGSTQNNVQFSFGGGFRF